MARFVERAADCDGIIVVGTPDYLEGHHSQEARVVAAEMDIVNQRLLGTSEQKETVLPVLAEGSPDTALPPLVRGRTRWVLRDDLDYLPQVFDLLLTIHRLDRDDDAVVAIRETLG